ncbi:hypothetical protein AZE42_10022 [Rhizopogon vesiculosus]|uniref:F-box domain-containing protein n=1 Tax=Rhizopogon vesiculosus TaxID=180088 RepID=A0A1J8R6U6_9AGAM|nr:hypothetical protein AZE42_10022 [Rhizopogon vesiculosus]
MGTHGYIVYRYRDMYFYKYNHWDSYPENLGVKTLDSIRYSNAITSKRQQLGEVLDKLDGRDQLDEDDDFQLSKHRPQNDILILWIYELDLDHNVFHINGMPFFDLECLPDSDSFLEYVCNDSKDHYGNITCPPICPPEQRYKRPAPPVINDPDIETYQSLVCTGTQVALSNLLAINDTLSPDEHVRVSLLEIMIGQCMSTPYVASMMQDLGLVLSPGQLTDNFWLTASSMANITFLPQMFDSEAIFHPVLTREEFTWVRKDTVLYISTYLDDKRCLQAAMSRLIDEILEETDSPGDYFGVAFSILHCAIIKVVKDVHTTTFSHTAALEFSPSFYAESPSMPGITALARLGYRIDPKVFVRATQIFRQPEKRKNKRADDEALAHGADGTPHKAICTVLPLELWREVALHLELPDLLTFGLISKSCREVASMVLRYPHICGYRLVAAAKEKPEYLMRYHNFLRASCFSAERAGVPATVLVGTGRDGWSSSSTIGIDLPFYPDFPIRVPVSAEVQAQAKESTLTSLEMERKMWGLRSQHDS